MRSGSEWSDLDFMQLQRETLYHHDAAGRLLAVNEPGGAATPHLFVGITRQGSVGRYRFDAPESLVREAERVLDSLAIPVDLSALAPVFEALRTAVSSHLRIEREYAGPAYRFPDRLVRPGGVTLITEANQSLLADHWLDLVPDLDLRQPILAVLRDGAAVSLCYTSRLGPRAAEAGVETLPAFRGNGFAAQATAAWASTIQGRGLIPLYSTWRENLASQAVARRLGLLQYGVDVNFQ